MTRSNGLTMQSGRGDSRGAAGFTLLEVLVATAILGTAVAALMGLLSGALRNAGRLQGPERALALGEAEMQELLVRSDRGRSSQNVLPLDQKVEGRWDDEFRWVAVATRFRAPEQPSPGSQVLVRVALNVFWKSMANSEEKKMSLETYQLWPEPARSTR